MYKIFLIIAVAMSLNACSVKKMWYGSDKPLMSFIVLEAELAEDGTVGGVKVKEIDEDGKSQVKGKKHLGALMSWSPEFNAAFISKSGNGCIQPATYSKNNSASAELPAEIISSGVSSGNIKGDFSQTLDKLITVTDQSTFLSIGMYGLCQMHANGALTDQQLTDLTMELFIRASSANGSSNDSTPTEKPKKENKATIKSTPVATPKT